MFVLISYLSGINCHPYNGKHPPGYQKRAKMQLIPDDTFWQNETLRNLQCSLARWQATAILNFVLEVPSSNLDRTLTILPELFNIFPLFSHHSTMRKTTWSQTVLLCVCVVRHCSKINYYGDSGYRPYHGYHCYSKLLLLLLLLLLLFDMDVSCHRPFLPGTPLEPAVIPTAHASSFTLQYFPYYVWCSKYSCLL